MLNHNISMILFEFVEHWSNTLSIQEMQKQKFKNNFMLYYSINKAKIYKKKKKSKKNVGRVMFFFC